MDISIFSSYPEFLAFVDEMGSDKCINLPIAHEGNTLLSFLLRSWYIFVIAAMCMKCEAIVDFSTTVTAEGF